MHNGTSNIRKLTLDSVEIESVQFNHQFTNVQSLSLKNQHKNMNYNQLKELVNFSSIRHIEFRSSSNYKLLFDILENLPTQISLTIDYNLVLEMMRKEDYLLHHFTKINSLHLGCNRGIGWETKYASKICTYFPKIAELIFEGFSDSSDALYLISSLEFLSILVTRCSASYTWDWTRLNWLFLVQQIGTYKKKSVICKWAKKARCLWIE